MKSRQKPARRNHYLPQSYLAGFTTSGTLDDFLHIFDLESPTAAPRRQRPRNVAFENDFHRLDLPCMSPDWVEQHVFGGFENEVLPAITEVVRRGSMVRLELNPLLQFVALEAVRNPRFRQCRSLLLEDDSGVPFEEALAIPQSWDGILQWCASRNVGWTLGDILRLLRDPESRSACCQLWHYLDSGMLQDGTWKLLTKRRWELCFSPGDGPHFICSDYPFSQCHAPPVVPYRVPGLDEPGTVVTFPLHRRAALVGRFERKDAVVDVGAEGVALINRGTIESAWQSRNAFVYSSGQDFAWLGEGGAIQNAAALFASLERARRGEIPFSSVPPDYFP